uniref:Ribosomal RNA large subunit methyltransferase H n=1 Tax=Vitrella brassicaformis TaxID=1169539 RepID=A0A7S1PDC6_9ALVE|mmetsp:Transcript_54123/g.136212  ORF Transcript_54123/g.136212 Transcript_54123/m.136212 type:complete len:184 (+) Transcript_54123:142-693(+)
MRELVLMSALMWCLCGCCEGYRVHMRRADGCTTRCNVRMVCEVTVRIRGKCTKKGTWQDIGCEQYRVRMRSALDVKTEWAANRDLSKQHAVVCLDVQGDEHTSESFSGLLYSLLQQGGSRVSVVIGGAEGLPDALRPKTGQLSGRVRYVSLSRMTFPHELARLILYEQLYRAVEIRKGTNYHK